MKRINLFLLIATLAISFNACDDDNESLVPAFSTVETIVNQNTAVTFSDNSTGSVTNRSWKFEGGTPSTSTEQNPSVVYKEAGVYTVELKVSNENGSCVNTKGGYISVLPAD